MNSNQPSRSSGNGKPETESTNWPLMKSFVNFISGTFTSFFPLPLEIAAIEGWQGVKDGEKGITNSHLL